MTPTQLKRFAADLDCVYNRHKGHLTGDSTLECLLLGIADLINMDGAKQTHDEVIGCLESAAEGIRHAAMDYYCSWK